MNDSNTEEFHRSRPAVTTIMPVRNGEKFIGAALESLRPEIGPRDEILVVDDGSTDASAEIARNFSGPIRVIQQIGSGCAVARNRALREVTTPWIAFLDADDLAYPDRILRLGQRMLEKDLPELVYGGQRRFFDNLPSATEVEEPLACLFGTMLLEKNVFTRAGLLDSSLRAGEILPWFAKVRQVGTRIAQLPGPVIRRRQHDNNLSATNEYRSAWLTTMRAVLAVRRG